MDLFDYFFAASATTQVHGGDRCRSNDNPSILTESVGRLMYLRVYDRRDSSSKPTPSPSVWYSFTDTHSSVLLLYLLGSSRGLSRLLP
jgi:hypothetical protein